MALVPLATKGNYFHVYDFRVKPGRGDDFIELFNQFDYGDNNPFHRSAAQVKDGVLCRDAADPAWKDEYRRWRPPVERAIAWLVARGSRRVPYRGITSNNAWLANRAAALNLRRLVNLGLTRTTDGTWALA